MPEDQIKILIVEDNEINAIHLEGMLAADGSAFALDNVKSLAEGIEHLKLGQTDLVLLDLNLPDSSGLDTLVAIQSKNSGVPFVVLSGMDNEEIAVQAVKRGAQDYLIKGQVDRPLLIRSIHHALERHRLYSALEEARKAAQEMAETDFLTGLPNRHLFFDRLQQALARAKRSQTQVAVLFFDLDKFKSVNDTLGHAVGDGLLQSVANRVKNLLRESDTLARLGGDEFIVILEGFDHKDGPSSVAGKILESLSRPFEVEEHSIGLGTSIGISLFPDDCTDADTLVSQADLAMYHAKKEGGGIHRYNAGMSPRKSLAP